MKRRIPDFRLLPVLAVFVLGTGFFFGNDAEDAYEEGLDAFRSRDYTEALQRLDESLKEDPDYGPAQSLRPWIHLKLNRIEEARRYFEKAYRENARDINAVEGMAWVSYLDGESGKARSFFQEQAALAAEHILDGNFWRYTASDQRYLLSVRSDAHYGLALIAQREGDRSSAIAYLEKALEDPNDFMPVRFILLPLVDYYFEDQAYAKAADLLERTLRKQEEPDRALMIKAGWAYYSMEDFERAKRIFQRSLSLHRQSAESLYGLAWCAYKLNRLRDVQFFLQRVMDEDPHLADTQEVRDLISKHPADLFSLWKTLGLSYHRRGDHTAARNRLKTHLKKHPNDSESLLAMGWSSRWSGALQKAEESFQHLIRLEGNRADYHVGLGSVYLARGNLEDAREALELALAIDGMNPNAHNGLGHYHLSRGNKIKARWHFEEALKLDPTNYDSIHQLATMHYQEEDYEAAVPYYDRLLKNNPKAVAPHNMLGWCYYHLRRHEASEQAFLRSRRLHPELADCHYGLGLLYADRNADREAAEELGIAIDIAPSYAHTGELKSLLASRESLRGLYVRLGWSYYRLQAYQKALEAFEQYRGKDSGLRLSSIRGQAWCHHHLGRYGEAYDLFHRVRQAGDEHDVDARLGMGMVLFNKKEYAESLRILEAIVREHPNLTEAWRTLAAIHEIQGEPEKAEPIYARLRKTASSSLDIHNQKGWRLYAEERYRDAIKAFRRSSAASPQLGAPHYGLGLSHLHLHQDEEAEASLRQGIQLQPDFMDRPSFHRVLESKEEFRPLRSHMGWSYFRKQQYNDALFHFQQMLKLDPKHTDALLGKGTVLYTRGDYQGAIDHYARLIPQVPAHSDSWDQWSYMLNNYGWCHYFLGSYTEAVVLFQRLDDYHRDLNVIAPLNGLGWSYMKTGDHEKARKAFLRSLWLLPGNYLAQLGMNLLKTEQETGNGGSLDGLVSAD